MMAVITEKQLNDIAESVHLAIKAIAKEPSGYILLLPFSSIEGDVLEEGKEGVLMASNYSDLEKVIPIIQKAFSENKKEITQVKLNGKG